MMDAQEIIDEIRNFIDHAADIPHPLPRDEVARDLIGEIRLLCDEAERRLDDSSDASEETDEDVHGPRHGPPIVFTGYHGPDPYFPQGYQFDNDYD